MSARVYEPFVVEEMDSEGSPNRSSEDNLKEIFDLCDRDRDGYITAQDFRRIGKEHFGNTQVFKYRQSLMLKVNNMWLVE